MDRIITIEKREELEGKNGTYLKLTDSEGKSHFVFDDLQDKWSLCEEGKSVSLTKKKDGKYWNVTDIKPAEEPTPTGNSKPIYGQDSPEKRRSIERQKAVELALAHHQQPEEALRTSLIRAEFIYQWINEGKLPAIEAAIVPSSMPDKQQPVAQKVKPPSDSPASEKQPALVRFTDGPDLVSYAMKQKKMSWAKIQRDLGITVPADIKDIPAAMGVLGIE